MQAHNVVHPFVSHSNLCMSNAPSPSQHTCTHPTQGSSGCSAQRVTFLSVLRTNTSQQTCTHAASIASDPVTVAVQSISPSVKAPYQSSAPILQAATRGCCHSNIDSTATCQQAGHLLLLLLLLVHFCMPSTLPRTAITISSHCCHCSCSRQHRCTRHKRHSQAAAAAASSQLLLLLLLIAPEPHNPSQHPRCSCCSALDLQHIDQRAVAG
jgi:hypothetical protein